mmetsp:Transcript_32996/g.60486  ORF Transcript_32996/g.60486 Transcript_32996/m.60486 type:complete len:83 (+) Transcript_32996:191-439(+)
MRKVVSKAETNIGAVEPQQKTEAVRRVEEMRGDGGVIRTADQMRAGLKVMIKDAHDVAVAGSSNGGGKRVGEPRQRRATTTG